MRSTTEVSRSLGSRREDLLSDWLLRRRLEMKFWRFLAEAPSLCARVLTLSVSRPEFYTDIHTHTHTHTYTYTHTHTHTRARVCIAIFVRSLINLMH